MIPFLLSIINLIFAILFQMKKTEDARRIYERLVTRFPNAGRYWKIYIEHEVHIFSFKFYVFDKNGNGSNQN